MHIGVDASCWINRRGFGRFTREILRALLSQDGDNRYTFLIDSGSRRKCSFPSSARVVGVACSRPPARAASAGGARSPADLWRFSRAAAAQPFDVFFFPAVYSYFPLRSGPRAVIAFHDTIAEKHPDLVFPTLRGRSLWRLKCWMARRRADLLLTVSHYSRRCLSELWRIPPQRLRVVSEAPGAAFRPLAPEEADPALLRRFGIEGRRFFIYAGGISPHKNLPLLIDAFERLRRRPGFSDLHLLLAGDYSQDNFHSSFPEVKRRAGANVVFTGFVEDEALAVLMNAALAFVFPSLDEGFGLPAVEAMACGTPVVASNAGSLPEVIGTAGIFFPPRDGRQLLEALAEVAANPGVRRRLSGKSLRRASAFCWKQSARRLREVLEEAAGQ